MTKKLFKAEVIGFIFVCILGTLSHFIFELTGECRIAGLFCPVNESVFEHLKLIYFPYLLYSAAEYFALGKSAEFFSAKLSGVLCGMLFMVALFYTYSGIIGTNVLFMDILIFIISVFIAFFISYTKISNQKASSNTCENFSLTAFIIITVLFFIFTFSPPMIPVFKDMANGIYGI